MIEISVVQGSLLEVQADAIVNPANSLGLMGGGVAGVIKRFGGEQIEKEAVSKAPIPVGSAVLTSAGKLPFKGVIHAPTMEEPAMETTEEKVRKAVRAVLELADNMGFESIAMPGMGTGVGRLPKDVSARAMIEEVRNFQPKNLKRVILVDLDRQMVEEWKRLL
ncbi:ADP-ribose-binding protein [Pampinifervens florentissimum]|uniref:ADP-ribose-binding protein n=1 Tax=Pampinifervens florentissimum TaxID=1632019 RepID=UPI0020C565D8|nr:ADP-ribose-binding protein [Hydrogenobacter sp. T-8]